MLQYEVLRKEAEDYYDKAVELRRSFHRIPELGMEEHQTTAMIVARLEELAIPFFLLEPTGVVAYLGPADAYTIGLRADIDGLKVTEETGLSYASERPGFMHACGHDAHMAGLLVAAEILKKHEQELDVRVKLIFQPSEENTLGAKAVLKQNVMDDVDEIFGLHIFTDLETGVISVEEGPRMAQTDRFSITFIGCGGHAGKPHQCVDATVMAADFVMSLQPIVAREVNPTDSAVVTVGHLASGTQYNIISGTALVEGTCRSFSTDVAMHLKAGIEKRARNIADYYGGGVKIDYDYGSHPPVINDSDLTERIHRQAVRMLGKEKFQTIPKLMLGEDFSWYQTLVPGVFAFVGGGNQEKGMIYPNHHPKFAIDEDALKDATMLHLSAVCSAEVYQEELKNTNS